MKQVETLCFPTHQLVVRMDRILTDVDSGDYESTSLRLPRLLDLD